MDIDNPHEVLMLRFDAQLYFANVDYFKESVLKEIAVKGDKLKYLIINAESMVYMDSTAVAMLKELIVQLNEKGVSFKIAGCIGPIRDIMYKTELDKAIGSDNIYVRTAEAYEDVTKSTNRNPLQEQVSRQHK